MAAERKARAFEDWDGRASGVICAFGFGADGVRALPEPRLSAAARGGEWSWTHVALGDVRAQALVRSVEGLPAEALELFVTSETRVQITEEEGWVFGVLPDLERDFSGHLQGAGRLVFALDGARLLTGRLHPQVAIDDLRRQAQSGETFGSPGAAIFAFVQDYIDRVEQVLDDLAQQLAGIEDYVLTGPRYPRDTGLNKLRRSIARHRRELQGLRTVLARAHAGRRKGRRVAALSEELAELIVAVEDADRDTGVLQERGRLLHEEIDTLINSATNRSMRALTIVSTLLIPPTLVTGAFGMNLEGIPFAHSQGGFAAAAALCALVVGAALLLLRRLGM